MPIETPSDGLDLAAMHDADAAVEGAAATARTEALRGRLAPELAALPAPLRAAFDRLVAELGRVDARAEAARQAALEARRSRGDWLRIDPLRHIPEDRAAPPPPPPARYEIFADDPDFLGFGWHGAEGQGRGSWRWSGILPVASVIVPDLGGGALAVELDLEVPYGAPFPAGAVTVLANGEPMELAASAVEGSRATLSGRWEGTAGGGTNLGLVILAPPPPPGPGGEARRLSIGLRRVMAARL